MSERYILFDLLLFKLNVEKERAVLAIPEVCVDQMIALYHSSLFAGHQGVIKTYLTMSDKFFIPDLMHYLRSYIKGCHICQLSNNNKIPNRLPMKDQFELQTFTKIKCGPKGNAKVIHRTQVHTMCHR